MPQHRSAWCGEFGLPLTRSFRSPVPPKSAVAAVFIVLIATAAPAQEMRTPRIRPASINWSEVRFAPAPDLAGLNRATSSVFPKIAASPVPVLLPFNVEAFLRDCAQQGAKQTSPPRNCERGETNKTLAYLRGFVSKFFVPGGAGYDAAFLLDVRRAPTLNNLRYRGIVEIQISGSSIIYELTAPSKTTSEPGPAEFRNKFQGLRKVLQEDYLRYTFLRYNAPYVISAYCGGKLSCDEADDILTYVLSVLEVVGGTPAPNPRRVALALDRPSKDSKSFTYYSPGHLLDGTGYKRGDGRADYTVYSNIRFPIARAPAFANSQVFMHGGYCYPSKSMGSVDHCPVNDKELHLFEGHKENFSYPWSDNFCEYRDRPVGQCPNGYGHQGQDIRPGLQSTGAGSSSCKLKKGTKICEPYQHDVVAVRNSYVWREKEQGALVLIVNESNEHIKFRYLHMYPPLMDKAQLFTRKTEQVPEGRIIGKVGRYDERKEYGTSYHLHFDMQVPTQDGWVFVSPYMTLVSAYERLIGGKGALKQLGQR